MKNAPDIWYSDEKMVNAVNRCMEAIHAVGLSADGAEYLPACLEKAIVVSNRIAAREAQFTYTPVSVEKRRCGYDVSPIEIDFVQ